MIWDYFIQINKNFNIIGFANSRYLFDSHKTRSQTYYLFTCGGAAISWQSGKQTITTTSSNYPKILAIHEASEECI